jgi:hypothetical protein
MDGTGDVYFIDHRAQKTYRHPPEGLLSPTDLHRFRTKRKAFLAAAGHTEQPDFDDAARCKSRRSAPLDSTTLAGCLPRGTRVCSSKRPLSPLSPTATILTPANSSTSIDSIGTTGTATGPGDVLSLCSLSSMDTPPVCRRWASKVSSASSPTSHVRNSLLSVSTDSGNFTADGMSLDGSSACNDESISGREDSCLPPSASPSIASATSPGAAAESGSRFDTRRAAHIAVNIPAAGAGSPTRTSLTPESIRHGHHIALDMSALVLSGLPTPSPTESLADSSAASCDVSVDHFEDLGDIDGDADEEVDFPTPASYYHSSSVFRDGDNENDDDEGRIVEPYSLDEQFRGEREFGRGSGGHCMPGLAARTLSQSSYPMVSYGDESRTLSDHNESTTHQQQPPQPRPCEQDPLPAGWRSCRSRNNDSNNNNNSNNGDEDSSSSARCYFVHDRSRRASWADPRLCLRFGLRLELLPAHFDVDFDEAGIFYVDHKRRVATRNLPPWVRCMMQDDTTSISANSKSSSGTKGSGGGAADEVSCLALCQEMLSRWSGSLLSLPLSLADRRRAGKANRAVAGVLDSAEYV